MSIINKKIVFILNKTVQRRVIINFIPFGISERLLTAHINC